MVCCLYSKLFPNTPYLLLGAKASVFDGGTDESPRKKRKTNSPPPIASTDSVHDAVSWQDQLVAAACAVPPTSVHLEKSALDGSLREAQNAGTQTTARAEICGGEDRDGSIDRVELNQASSQEPDKMPRFASRNKSPKAASPPKKMLKISADGKLGSPKARNAPKKSPVKRRRRSAKGEPGSKSKITILKYGSDEDSRRAIGQQIEDIHCGVTYLPKVAAPLPVPKASGPLKPTHPFFLGPAAQTPKPRATTPSGDPKPSSNDMRKTEEDKSPVNAPGSARKPSVNASAWANIRGFGGIPLGSTFKPSPRLPGAVEAIWPPKDLFSIDSYSAIGETHLKSSKTEYLPTDQRKQKDAHIEVPETDEVLRPFTVLVHNSRASNRCPSIEPCFERPTRMVLTGPRLQDAVRPQLDCGKLLDRQGSSAFDVADRPTYAQPQIHHAILYAYQSIATSSTAFDRYECESRSWAYKHAPGRAEEVLQSTQELWLLRDWLRSWTVNSVENQRNDNKRADLTSSAVNNLAAKRKKKRQKKSEGLDGFVISSDEEADELQKIGVGSEPTMISPPNSQSSQSGIRAGSINGPDGQGSVQGKAVIISGPHGCGKTAAVYAIAQELGFDVFEINSSGRRSGRDVLDRVGDMTLNHLVNNAAKIGIPSAADDEPLSQISEEMQQDIDSGKQTTVQSFFKPKNEQKSPRKGRKKGQSKLSKAPTKPRTPQSQKQSLILLEEVDVLFEEDKQFWTTILDLVMHSKRPIIMTCTDEALLPSDDMSLYAIFRFTAPPEPLVADRLLLMTCNEGHLLSRQSILSLYRSKCSDLRATIAQLQFFCQLALGDRKGGLEWLLAPRERCDENGQTQRVVSQGTYSEKVGYIGSCDEEDMADNSKDTWTRPSFQTDGRENSVSADNGNYGLQVEPTSMSAMSDAQALERLKILSSISDCLSAADTFSYDRSHQDYTAVLEKTQPELNASSHLDYVDGSKLVQADPVANYGGQSGRIPPVLTSLAARIARSEHLPIETIMEFPLFDHVQGRRKICSMASTAFEPIAHPSKGLALSPKGPLISAFEASASNIFTDLAPYIRSIVSYDVRLEEQRRQLSDILSRGEKGSKRLRTTRASRAALEGGSKASTRRERWFPSDTDFRAVLKTGGEGWGEITLSEMRSGSEEPDELA